MLSIITSIHNQLGMNQLFYEKLCAYTTQPFELIIIDNASTDGSREFFRQQAHVQVVGHEGNYNYPYCQNRGIEVAKYDILCFLNNDLIVSPGWDRHIYQYFGAHPQSEVISVATNDHVESKMAQRKLHRRWKRIKYTTQFLAGNRKHALAWMHHWMYGDWKQFTQERFQQWQYQTLEGYSGSAIIMQRRALAKIGMWDERIQAADFDLFNRVKERALTEGDIQPIQLLLGIYFHHYQRLTMKSDYPPFQNKDQMIRLDEKWGRKTEGLRKDIIG
ncbi:MAG: glycosyltransferase [Bacteroidota bacterium]